KALRDYLRNYGRTLEGGDEPTTHDYARLLQAARGRPDYQVLQTMCLRSLQQAIYSPEESGHFGLAYQHYAHFTSPIRRYPDLLTPCVIKAIRRKEKSVPDFEDVNAAAELTPGERQHGIWEKLGLLLSARERRADDASRDVEAWLTCWFVKEHVGEVFRGRVAGVAPCGLFVPLDALFVDGLVHVSEVGSDYFHYNDRMDELRGGRTGSRCRLTDAVHVQLA